MSIHYHGTPVTPRSRLVRLAGRSLCISYATFHKQDGDDLVEWAHRHGQSVMLDNGAFSFWRSGREMSDRDWQGFFDWAAPWLDYQTTWGVIPDVIDGTEEENDRLVGLSWSVPRMAPVWHMHERIDRLKRLCQAHQRVCIGSSAQYAVVGSGPWHRRMEEAMNELCGSGPAPTWLHMLRGMDVVDAGYPFASVDSTNIAQNHARNGKIGEGIGAMADRLDVRQAPGRWRLAHTQQALVP